MKLVTVVQARRGSTRLPDKVMMPILGRTVLERQLERMRAARQIGTLVVATTTDEQDDVIPEICATAGVACFRGHPTDLLDRHYQAALQFGAEAVVKIPSDCPLIDPTIIDRVIERFRAGPLGAGIVEPATGYDYVSNLHPATYPDGNDVEVMTFAALEQAWREAGRGLEREHTTPFFWENPDRFRLGNVEWESGLDYSMSHRWTLDYTEDYRFIVAVYEALYPKYPCFTLVQILELLGQRPDLAALNSLYAGVNWYRHHLNELRTVGAHQTVTTAMEGTHHAR